MVTLQTNLSEVELTASDINRDYIGTVLPLSIVYGILCAIGIFGNGFILYVYFAKYPTCNFRFFVIVLGIIDLTRCTLTIPAEIYTQYTWFTTPISEICKAKSFLNVASVTCSPVILLLIAVDRYRKVCCPLRWQIQHACALKLSIFLCIISVVWSVPAAVFCGPQTNSMNYAGTTVVVTICLQEDAYKDTIWPGLIMKALYAGPNAIIMLTTLVLYILIARNIYRRTSRRFMRQKPSVRTVKKNEDSIDESAEELSDTADDPSMFDSSSIAIQKDRKSKETSTSSDGTEPDSVGTAHKIENEQCSGRGPSTTLDAGELGSVGITHKIRNEQYEQCRGRGPSRPPDIIGSHSIPIARRIRNKQLRTNPDSIKHGPGSSKFLFDVKMIDLENINRAASSSAPVKRSAMYPRASRRRQQNRLRRNTLIMFILTVFFVVSTSIYYAIAILLSDTDVFFNKLTLWQGILMMFFLRLYYFNSLFNAIVYGLLDPRFRRALKRASRRMSLSMTSAAVMNRRR